MLKNMNEIITTSPLTFAVINQYNSEISENCVTWLPTMLKNITCFCLLLVCVLSTTYDYYWRDYNGTIPEDAFPGATDKYGNNIYIGQIYVHCYGLCIGAIYSGQKEVNFYCWGKKKLTDVIKILCTGHRENFKWLQTTSSGFHLDTIDKHVVIGGYDGKAAAVHNYNIGRIQYDGIVQIGIVDTLGPENVCFYFLYKGIEHKCLESYEVLIYERAVEQKIYLSRVEFN